MRLANFGILLLTTMVMTKYVISLYSFRVTDGSFKTGITFDYKAIRYDIAELKSRRVNDRLMAFNSVDDFKTTLATHETNTAIHSGSDFESQASFTEAASDQSATEPEDDEPLPMDYRNSLVVYDIGNPSNSLIGSTYEDVEDDTPLDNGNTIISGMMLLMPRR